MNKFSERAGERAQMQAGRRPEIASTKKASPIARLADKLNDISPIFPPLKNIVFEVFALLAIVYWLARHWKML